MKACPNATILKYFHSRGIHIHPMTVFPASGRTEDIGTDMAEVVVVGHCCESGDLMASKPGQSEDLSERRLCEAQIGDILIIDHSAPIVLG